MSNIRETVERRIAQGKWTLMDYVDQFILGPADIIDRVAGLFVAYCIKPTPRNKQRFPYYDTVRFKVPRSDKHHEVPTVRQIVQHLRRYGVQVFWFGFSADYMFFRVRKNQEKWARQLFTDDWQLHGPRRAWGDK